MEYRFTAYSFLKCPSMHEQLSEGRKVATIMNVMWDIINGLY